ncbi:MAG: hypothetical protein QS721_05335 [Candidatus Endonucleobacter sp. (ex Gigantidas childressi)]|nr:hypothetical protein [Candidatus Endonucleobacter sp. (ex Gigantidas childressi)]
MSTKNKLIASFLLMTITASSFATSRLSVEAPANPFDIGKTKSPPKEEINQVNKNLPFCKNIRAERERNLRISPDLEPRSLVRLDDSSLCFSSEEHLLFTANQEAQIILGPHASWHIGLSKKNMDKAVNACRSVKFEEFRNKVDYDICVEELYKGLMGPYDERYRRDAKGYIKRRTHMAHSLVSQCNMALKAKKPLLPKDLVLPAAIYDRTLNSIPSWMLEEGALDNIWLSKKGRIKVTDVMHAILGTDCPGNMVLWVTY